MRRLMITGICTLTLSACGGSSDGESIDTPSPAANINSSTAQEASSSTVSIGNSSSSSRSSVPASSSASIANTSSSSAPALSSASSSNSVIASSSTPSASEPSAPSSSSVTSTPIVSRSSSTPNTGAGSSVKSSSSVAPVAQASGNSACDITPGVVAQPEAPLPSFNNSANHHHTPSKMAEHQAALNLTAYEDATHAAITSGDWCDASIWHNKAVPGDGARVVIPHNTQVSYALQDTARLHTLRVDGELNFATNTDTRMTLDTLLVDPRGTLTIGTSNNPVARDVMAEIIIADNGDIDVDWDPMLLSRGVVIHGTASIHGAPKTSHLKLDSEARAGDSVLTMASRPSNWQIGDTLVISGTHFSGWKWDNSIRATRYYGTEDEVRTITRINGSNITLNAPLNYNHLSPRSDLAASVGNFSRNIRIASEGGASLPPHQRGHVMFMHNDDIDVRYAEFFELGRTDKSKTNLEAIDLSTPRANSNVRGRYSFHFHRAGTSNQDHPAIGVGNAVFGSPGWGYVHHDSHAVLHDNVSFNTFGAGFVAETGNETGVWTNNLTIKAEGVSGALNPKNNNDIYNYDIARSGDGFWFQGRLVGSVGNIAASVNRGFTYFHRDHSGTMINIPPARFMMPQALGLARDSGADDIPIRHFHNNEAYASTTGVFVVKANPKQGHDINTVMSNFTAWEVQTGASIEYTAHYLLRDFDVIGLTSEPFRRPQTGIEFGRNTTDMVVRGAKIQGFATGIDLEKDQVNDADLGKDQFVVIDAQMTNVDAEYLNRDDTDLIITDADLVPGRFAIDLEQGDDNDHFEYTDPATTAGTGVSYSGTKTDSIGETPLPSGSDSFGTDSKNMIAIVKDKGYYRTAEGDAYTVVEEYYSDRATGDVHMRGLKTYLGPDVDSMLGNQYFAWRDAKYIGSIDLDNQAPTARDDTASVAVNRQVRIAVISNDSDPEGDSLRINEVVHPVNGRVKKGAKQITYTPNIDFRGTDTFHYFVSDGQGNFSRAEVVVTVN